MYSSILIDPKENIVDFPLRLMFIRRGAYMGVCADLNGGSPGQVYRKGRLYIGTRRGTPTGILNRDIALLYLTPMYQGGKVEFAMQSTPTELKLVTPHGTIKACFAEDRLLYFQGEQGLSLKLEAKMLPGELMKHRGREAWEAVFFGRCSLVLNPLQGALKMSAPWDAETASTPIVSGMIEPDSDGRFLLSVEESAYAGKVRPAYPSYAEALQDVTEDWEHFLSCVPKFNDALEAERVRAAWTLWSFLINPSGNVKRPHIFMGSRNVASSWQMAHNAAALRNNVPLATDLMLNMVDTLSPQGQFADFVDDGKFQGQTLHPPTQGWALKWIMKDHDIGAEIPADKLEQLYDGYVKWTEWFMFARDDDRDGLPSYDNGDECGFDDSSAFVDYDEVESPDLLAYLAQQYDALGDLAEILNKPEEAAAWHSRCDEFIDRMIKTFWDGEHFFALSARTHEKIWSDSILFYVPLTLGKKLPKDIVDKMTADLLDESRFLTPFGLATEVPDSDVYRISGFSRGWVLPANNLLILTGMYDAGKVDEAKMIAARYCDACAKWSSPTLLNAVRGGKGGFICSWSACTFLTLADMLCNM